MKGIPKNLLRAAIAALRGAQSSPYVSIYTLRLLRCVCLALVSLATAFRDSLNTFIKIIGSVGLANGLY